MNRRWPAMVGRVVWVLLTSALLGLLFGHLLLTLLVGISSCLVWQLWHLYKLERWLGSGMRSPPPVEDDVWVDVYRLFCRLRQRGRKRKRKLGRILRQFRDASAALPEAVVVLSDEDEVLWLNAAARRFLGLQTPQDIGLRITHVVRQPSFVRFLARQQYNEESVEFASPVNNEQLLNVRITPYGKKRRLLIAKDITEPRRLEQMRRDFVANVSHELRTPLTVINGYLETLLDRDDDWEDEHSLWRQPLQRMQEQSSRMLHMIEDLLMLSRLETATERRPERSVDVPAMLAAIAEDARALSGAKAHEIRLEVAPDLWIGGCEQELRSAFSNLVFNAVRYTPAEGHISLRWFADEQGLHFEVEDDGEGIPQQHIPRLTERFYRVDRGRQRKSGGTGLGLAIVKHVMNRHSGQLKIESRLGVGSVFTCNFPQQRQVDRALPSASNQ